MAVDELQNALSELVATGQVEASFIVTKEALTLEKLLEIQNADGKFQAAEKTVEVSALCYSCDLDCISIRESLIKKNFQKTCRGHFTTPYHINVSLPLHWKDIAGKDVHTIPRDKIFIGRACKMMFTNLCANVARTPSMDLKGPTIGGFSLSSSRTL